MQCQNQYPVIFISLKDLKDLSFQDQLNNFQIIPGEIINRSEELLIGEHLDETDRDLLKRYKTGTVNKTQLQNGLRPLSNCLEKYWKKKVVLLIDEQALPARGVTLLYKAPT